MNYIKVDFAILPIEPFRDMLTVRLAEIGFESFVDTNNGVEAFIPEPDFSEQTLQSLDVMNLKQVNISFNTERMPAQNWNAKWESDFHPIEVSENCRVRAPFHEAKNLEYEIIISPKMSFGTGHHETTWLMLRQMLQIDLRGSDVLDMGTGTGVLAILAAKMNAKKVVAIDVDQWAYENALENVYLNSPVDIDVEKGGVAQIGTRNFHVILANINKNVLLQDLPIYAEHLRVGGRLLLSGFFESDAPDLIKRAAVCGFVVIGEKNKNNWAVLELQKN